MGIWRQLALGGVMLSGGLLSDYAAWWELIISFDKESYVPVMSGPTRLSVKNIPFNKSNARISPASLGRSHALRLGTRHCTSAFNTANQTCKALSHSLDIHTVYMHADALIRTHATTFHVAAVAVKSFKKKSTHTPACCWSLMGNEPFCLAAGAYSRAWQVVMVHLRYIQRGHTLTLLERRDKKCHSSANWSNR